MKNRLLNIISEKFRVEGELSPWNIVHFDSRLIKKGDWFVALAGENNDGHLYIPQAIQNGASVILADEIWWNKTDDIPSGNYIITSHSLSALQQIASIYRTLYKGTIVAITGSTGKTTTRDWIVNVLKQNFNVASSCKNYNNHIGLPYSILNSDINADYWVIELGSNHPGEIAFLAEILKPDWSLVTNIGTAHLGFFKSKEDIYREKSSLFSKTMKDGKVFINMDDPFLGEYIGFTKLIKLSVKEKTEYSFELIGCDKLGRYNVKTEMDSEIKLPVPGSHQAMNALFAYAIGLEAEMKEEMVINGIQSFSATDKRMEIIQETPYIIVNDAYNANKESIFAAGKFLKEVEANRKIMVLGDVFELGKFSREIHTEIVDFLDNLDLNLILTIGEETKKVSNNIIKTEHKHFEKHEEIKNFLKENLYPGDILLLKASRGMQLEKILEG
ncbi:MAG: UDP-N-acetylmuramoyl-tripeptide--D-alanyl-D-alanine ligase [Calditrichia bacterium]|nr:UDP-N-acetylmuramoyl-tripeptide--D-alanyl-D-alanine ligase [Calditrichia bacterium]